VFEHRAWGPRAQAPSVLSNDVQRRAFFALVASLACDGRNLGQPGAPGTAQWQIEAGISARVCPCDYFLVPRIRSDPRPSRERGGSISIVAAPLFPSARRGLPCSPRPVFHYRSVGTFLRDKTRETPIRIQVLGDVSKRQLMQRASTVCWAGNNTIHARIL
jgi:hypothetical protein